MSESKTKGLLLAGVGSILGSMTISGFLLGYLTDVWLDTMPIFLFLLGVLGFVGGILKAYKLLSHPDFNKLE